ncbi:hypothetical protein PLICRDRAFT_29860 [Plicaturopsis crispa FD-325 SS-3]|nr:hypothetical protein PLICRDRAFT_29860 [Plicaturopsis crispa FD-325 SS-3]
MASATATQTQTRSSGQRGRGGNKNRGRGNRGGGPARTAGANRVSQSTPPSNGDVVSVVESAGGSISSGAETIKAPEADEEDLCFICAEPVKYYSVSQCNHRTCHVCSLRLRALYKKMDCTFCKDPQPSVIFTTSPDAPFLSYTPESIPLKDSKLAISFETQEMMEETMILLRFNCPDASCDHVATGWNDLRLHVRAVHGKMMCDLCIRSKKVFAHEHVLYAPNQLPLHLPSMPHRSYKSQPKEQIEGGIHPLCQFCRECFFSDDELYSHMRERHEECFICKRNEIRDQYFQNYETLEKHFTNAHHPCTQTQCAARKFVVFNSDLDLRAHMVEEHGMDMSSRDKKDARRIQAGFEFEEVGVGGRRGRGGRGDREHEREPPPHQPPAAPAPGPSRPTGGRRREGFGATLTVDGGSSSNSNTPQHSRRPSPGPPGPAADPVVAERHDMFIARLQSLTPNSANAVAAVKTAIRGYRASETSARDLISTVWNVLDRNLDDTASIVISLVDLLEEEDKKKDLLGSWNGFKIEQRRQFPDLIPTATGGGYSAITSGQVLNVKHSAASRSSHQSARQVLDRVAQAASSSSSSSRPAERFPPLRAAAPAPGPAFRQSQRSTPWAGSSAPPPPPAPTSVPGPGSFMRAEARGNASRAPPPPTLSKSLFPDLPASSGARVRAQVSGNQSLRNIRGDSAVPAPVWGTNGAGGANGAGNGGTSATADTTAQSDQAPGKGKKGKGKQKQTLFTLGSFPT